MLIRTPADLGAIIRERRNELKLGQAELAKRIGASRQWVVGIERGRARAEVGLVLRALDELSIRLDSSIIQRRKGVPALDAIIDRARKGSK